MVLAAIASPAHAANGTWNVNADGTWTTASNWLSSTIADGADSTAFFTFNITADRTVTLGANRTIGNITFTDSTTNSNNLTISGADILTLDVTAGRPVINVTQTARTLTIGSVVAGSDGLQKNGTGTLILSGANTYTGVTAISASGGTLEVTLLANGGSNSSIGAASSAAANLLLGNAGTLRYTGAGNVTTDRGFTINGTAAGHGATINSSGVGTLSFDNTVALAYGTANQTRTLTLRGTNTGNNTFGKVIANNGTGATSVTKSDAGLWVLNQSNSYTGVTSMTASGGTLEVTLLANGGSSSSIGAASNAAANLLLGNAGTLRYTGAANVTTDRGFTINGTAAGHGATINSSGVGTLSFDNTVALAYGTANQTRTLTLRGTNTGNNTFGKVIANNGTGATSVTKNDAGLWLLDQTNTYTGATTVSAGTLRAGAAAGGQAFGNLSAVTTANVASAVLSLNNFSQTIGSLAGGGTTGGNVSLSSATLTTGGLNTSTSYAGVISGSGGLTKVGTGTQTLTGTNTYTGPTLISAGTLQIGSTTAGSLSASSTITNNATLAFSRTNTLVVSNAIGGTGALVKVASGTITLTGNNTYTGTTTISAGTLQIGNAGTTGSLSPSSSITNNGTLAFSRTNTLTQGTDFASVIAGTGGVTKSSTGTLVLNGTNTYTGVTAISATGGTLQVTLLANGGANSSIGAASNAAANLLLGNATTFRYAGSANVTTNRGFTINGTAAGNGATIDSSGVGTLSFDNTVALAYGTANQTRTLTLRGTNTGNNTFGKVIANNGTGATSVTKSDTGRWVLTQANTYSGATTVNAGTLLLSGSGSINSTSAITVLAGATLATTSSMALTVAPSLSGSGLSNRAILGGTGTVNAAVTLNNVGDTLSPGTSPGILSFGVGQAWSAFSYDWELNDWLASLAGTNIDQVPITNGLNLTGAAPGSYVLNVLSLTAGNTPGNVPNFADSNRSWTILTTTTGITGFNASYWTIATAGFSSSPSATGTWNISQSGNNLVLNYVAVPEPSVFVLLACGLVTIPLVRAVRSRAAWRRS